MANWLTQSNWAVVKDIFLTAGGLVIVMAEVFFLRPTSEPVIIAGLAMAGLGASFHAGAVVSGFLGRSSDAQPPPGHSGSPHSPGPSGDRR